MIEFIKLAVNEISKEIASSLKPGSNVTISKKIKVTDEGPVVTSRSENVGQEKTAMDFLGNRLHENRVVDSIRQQIGLLRAANPSKNKLKIESLKKIVEKISNKSAKV